MYLYNLYKNTTVIATNRKMTQMSINNRMDQTIMYIYNRNHNHEEKKEENLKIVKPCK